MHDDQKDDLERRLDEYWPREEAEIRRRLPTHLSPEVVENAVRKRKERWYHGQRLQADMMRARREHADAFARIQRILARIDPIGYSGYPGYDVKTEYESEAGLITLRLREVNSLEELEQIVKESFIRGQSPLTVTEAGYLARYAESAREIWKALERVG